MWKYLENQKKKDREELKKLIATGLLIALVFTILILTGLGDPAI